MTKKNKETAYYKDLEYSTSAELCEKMAAECDTAILAFSCGKDSIASWLQMRRYFRRIVPYYCYVVPGLQFVEDSLKYYEDFFGCHIYRLPHRSFPRYMRQKVFQPPSHVKAIAAGDIPARDEYTDEIIGDIIRYSGKLPDAAFTGVGVRAADSPYRRIAIGRHGAINYNRKQFFPVYDWVKDDIIRAIDEAGIKLPVDYRLFGRTFDGLDYRFTKEIRDHFPEDYERLLEWYPFAELDIMRYEGFDTVRGRTREQVEGIAGTGKGQE